MDDSEKDRPHVYSSLAQLAEHAAVNRRVVGSNPTGGARRSSCPIGQLLFFLCKTLRSKQPQRLLTATHASARSARESERGLAQRSK